MKKLKYNKIIHVNYSEKEIKEQMKFADEGEIQAKLNLILHNQIALLNRLENKW